jgi:hypothetical protein
MAPERSPNRKYHVLLAHLRSKARRAFSAHRAVSESQNVDWLAMGGGHIHKAPLEQRLQPNQMSMTASLDTNIDGFDGNYDIASLNSRTNADDLLNFDTMALSWGYLDQLGMSQMSYSDYFEVG